MKQDYLDGSNSLVKQDTFGKSDLEESEFLRLLEKPQHILVTSNQDGPLSPDQLEQPSASNSLQVNQEEEADNAGEEDEVDQLADNIETFVQMGFLQIQADFLPKRTRKIVVPRKHLGRKKLLLLDMDETLLHAATLEDIYQHQIYGEGAEPTFVT
jgi:hypothetical protein